MEAVGRTLLAPMAIRVLRQAAIHTTRMTRVIQQKLASNTQPLNKELQRVAVRVTGNAGRQPVHPAALLRQSKRGARWSSSSAYARVNAIVHRFISGTAGSGGARAGPILDRAVFAKTNVGRAFAQFSGRTPFAHTLRPNLTGGAFPRTAGGYAIPGAGRVGGQRFFSHAPATHAQVVQNVSQAMRAFWLSGQRARFDGHGPNGEKRYRTVCALQDKTGRTMAELPRFTPGAFIDFQVSPTLTALSPLAAAYGVKLDLDAATLNADGFLDVLSVDFARQLKDLAAVMNDLKRLAILGDLPITLEKNNTLRVRFPGVDADTVESLCDDIGVQRGIVRQDAGFDTSIGSPMALCFPYAPVDEDAAQRAFTSPGGSMRSHQSGMSSMDEDAFFDEYIEEIPWLSSQEAGGEEGYESMSPPVLSSAEQCSEDFEGLEGIYRFLEECDRAMTKF